MAELGPELSGRDAPKIDEEGGSITREIPNQVRTGGGGQATPDDLPDAPVPWERSDATPMTPAEHSWHGRSNDERGPRPNTSSERSMTDQDKGTGPD
jgi:hypothetical protein